MNNAILTAKLLALVEGKETPESWLSWWSDHESELETLLSRGEFLRLKPCKHAFKWVPLLSSQKGAAGILEKSGTSFEISGLYQEQYERVLGDVNNETIGHANLKNRSERTESLKRK